MPHHELVRSLLRSLNILDVVAQSERGMTLKEICEVLKYRESTAYNLLRTLASRNFVQRTPPPVRYRLGRAVMRLANEVNNHELIQRASDTVKMLYHDARELLPRELEPSDELTVSFAQSIGGEIRVLLRIRNDQPDVIARPMDLLNPYRSTSSLIYQAYWTREERAAYRRLHPFAEHGAWLWKSEQELDRYLFNIRQEEVVCPPVHQSGEFRPCVPIFDENRVLMGVLGLAVWMKLNKLVRFRMMRRLSELAKQLSVPPPTSRNVVAASSTGPSQSKASERAAHPIARRRSNRRPEGGGKA